MTLTPFIIKSGLRLKNAPNNAGYTAFTNASTTNANTVTIPDFATNTLASVNNAQTFTGAQTFSTSIATPSLLATAASDLTIKTSTADGADNKSVILAGGGDVAASRGAYLALRGNEVGNGQMNFYTGAGAIDANTAFTFSGYITGDTQPTILSATGAGAWTLGPNSTADMDHIIAVTATGRRCIKWSSTSNNSTLATTIPNVNANSGGDRLNFYWNNSPVFDVRLVAGDGGTIGLMNWCGGGNAATGIHTAWYGATSATTFTNIGQVTAAGVWTLGPAQANAEHTANCRYFKLSGKAGMDEVALKFVPNGTDITAYIASNAAGALTFYNASSLRGSMSDAGAWTLGPSDKTGSHTLYGQTLIYATTTNPLVIRSDLASATNRDIVLFQLDGNTATQCGGVYCNAVGVSPGFYTSSDENLKEGITDSLTTSLDKLLRVKIREFWLRGKTDQPKTRGVIAQELQQIFPDKVFERNGILVVTSDYNYDLIKAIQELAAQNESLNSRIEALETK